MIDRNESDYNYIDDIWYDDYDEYSNHNEQETEVSKERINFSKYGKKNNDKDIIDTRRLIF